MKKMLLYCLVCMANLVMSVQIQGQARVSGIIADSLSSNELPGANIKVLNENKGTSADQAGYFRVDLAPGNYVLSISNVGYLTREIPVTVDGDINFLLYEVADKMFMRRCYAAGLP